MALEDNFKACRMMDKRTSADGYGGIVVRYEPGAEFMAGIVTDSSAEARVAYQQGLKRIYTIVTPELVVLSQGDVIRREEDGLLIRVTSNGIDMRPPGYSTLRFSQVQGEAVTE